MVVGSKVTQRPIVFFTKLIENCHSARCDVLCAFEKWCADRVTVKKCEVELYRVCHVKPTATLFPFSPY